MDRRADRGAYPSRREFARPLPMPRADPGRDGTGRDGTGRDGTGRDGTGRDGTGRDGTGRDGTGRDRMSTRESVPTDTRRAAGACPLPIQTALDVSAPRGRERRSPLSFLAPRRTREAHTVSITREGRRVLDRPLPAASEFKNEIVLNS
jgi:hypothetical protein